MNLVMNLYSTRSHPVLEIDTKIKAKAKAKNREFKAGI